MSEAQNGKHKDVVWQVNFFPCQMSLRSLGLSTQENSIFLCHFQTKFSMLYNNKNEKRS